MAEQPVKGGIFQVGDVVEFEEGTYLAICCDDETSVFGTYKYIAERDVWTTSYEDVVIYSNKYLSMMPKKYHILNRKAEVGQKVVYTDDQGKTHTALIVHVWNDLMVDLFLIRGKKRDYVRDFMPTSVDRYSSGQSSNRTFTHN